MSLDNVRKLSQRLNLPPLYQIRVSYPRYLLPLSSVSSASWSGLIIKGVFNPDLVLMGSWREVKEAELIRYEKLKELPWIEENWDIFLSELDAKFLSEDCLMHLKLSDDPKFWLDNKELDFWELLAFFY